MTSKPWKKPRVKGIKENYRQNYKNQESKRNICAPEGYELRSYSYRTPTGGTSIRRICAKKKIPDIV